MQRLYRGATSVARKLFASAPAPDECQQPSDDVLHARLMRTMRRRVSDDIAYVIERACLRDDWRTASELRTVLTNILERERKTFHRDTRGDNGLLTRMDELINAARWRAGTQVHMAADGKMEITILPDAPAGANSRK
jgi:hypothetical protein